MDDGLATRPPSVAGVGTEVRATRQLRHSVGGDRDLRVPWGERGTVLYAQPEYPGREESREDFLSFPDAVVKSTLFCNVMQFRQGTGWWKEGVTHAVPESEVVPDDVFDQP